MMKKTVLTILTLCCACILTPRSFLFGSTGPDQLKQGLASVTAREIRAHINFLASEHFGGRGNGDPGLELAAEYIATQFEDAGLEPIGDNGTYFQAFDLMYRKLEEPNLLEVTEQRFGAKLSTDYRLGVDFMPFGFTANKKVTAPLVFAGYGITAPEHKYNDYKGIDVNGKIVLVLRHEPQEKDTSSVFNGDRWTKYADWEEKALTAQKHGAVGMLMVTDPNNHDTFSVGPIEQIWPENPSARHKRLALPDPEENITIPAAHITMTVAEELLAGTGQNLGKIQQSIDATLKAKPFSVRDKIVTIQSTVREEIVTVRNVVGMVKGSGNQAILIGAHYDHDGLDSDRIYYGADDDASGTVGLLELSEAFMLSSERPERSIILMAFAAEEKGLLGSKYYVDHPLIPLSQTVAMIQMDMIGRNEDTASMSARQRRGVPVINAEESKNTLHAIGTTYSSDMKEISERNNLQIGLDVDYTYDNVQQLVQRSDQWPFLQKEVPAIFYTTGFHSDYHTPEDTPDKIDAEKMEKVLKLVYLTAWDLANGEDNPQYKKPEAN